MQSGAEVAVDRRPVSWTRGEREWTPGFSDWLGDRFLDFDLATSTSLERLQFRREFGESSAFETALRERVEALHSLQHPSLESVRAVVRVPGHGLILESKHTAGRRLSEIFPEDRGAVMALDLIRQLIPMLVLVHRAGEGFAHGAIGAERIVVTRDGRLVLSEHVLGSAIAAQLIPAIRWRAQTSLPTHGELAAPDVRGDLIQLAFLALSLLLGRRLSPAEYPANVERLVGESAMAPGGRSPEAAWLRRWIERALQVGPDPFASAFEAYETLNELSDAGTVQPAAPDRALRIVTSAAPPAPAPIVTAPAMPAPPPVERVAAARPPAAPPRPVPVAVPPPAPAPPARVALEPHAPAPVARARGRRGWLVPGLSALAIAQGLAIAALIVTRPAASAPAAPAEPAPRQEETRTQPAVTHAPMPERASAPSPGAALPSPADAPLAAAAADRTPASPAAERFGGLRVSSPMPLQVFEGDKLVGTTQGPIAMTEGVHALDLVDDALAFRLHVAPTVKAGQMTPVAVPVPNGTLSVNAVPWADVLIDGKPAGQTPLANLSVPIGQHEIVFRHPQFGEQRQIAVVKADAPARVSLTFSK